MCNHHEVKIFNIAVTAGEMLEYNVMMTKLPPGAFSSNKLPTAANGSGITGKYVKNRIVLYCQTNLVYIFTSVRFSKATKS